MSLEQQGYKFIVSPCKQHAKWVHPLEVPTGWQDCTKLDSDALAVFLALPPLPNLCQYSN